jgi:DNA processing protein
MLIRSPSPVPNRMHKMNENEEEEALAALALAMAPGLPSHQKVLLVRQAGSCRQAAAAIHGGLSPDLHRRAERDLAGCRRSGIRLITLSSPDYPSLLEACTDPPLVLHIRGTLEPRDQIALAIVGSRRATPYGIEAGDRLSGDLAGRGITIVSGLARGIDAVAHRAALEAGGRTIAVLGSGLDVVYPREHRVLAERIAQSGAVVSELPLASPPLPGHFPRRNRIVSGLAVGTLVIEAAEQSGSLISARLALEENREVYAVPGPITSPNSAGVHRLIQDGAKLVTDATDVIEELRPELREKLSPTQRSAGVGGNEGPDLQGDEKLVYEALGAVGPADADRLVSRTATAPHRITTALVGLELKGLVRCFPGNIYGIKFVR